MAWLERHSCRVERPLFHWKTKDILKLCRQHGVLNPLYDEGFSRVGCFPCFMENKAGLAALARYAPERIDLIAQAEAGTSHTFFPYSKVPDSQCLKPGIRGVIRWAGGQHPSTLQALTQT